MKERLHIESHRDVMLYTRHCCELNKESIAGMKRGHGFKAFQEGE